MPFNAFILEDATIQLSREGTTVRILPGSSAGHGSRCSAAVGTTVISSPFLVKGSRSHFLSSWRDWSTPAAAVSSERDEPAPCASLVKEKRSDVTSSAARRPR